MQVDHGEIAARMARRAMNKRINTAMRNLAQGVMTEEDAEIIAHVKQSLGVPETSPTADTSRKRRNRRK